MHQSGIEINVKLALHWSLNWYSPSFGLCLSPVCYRNDRSCSGDRGIPEKVMAPNCKKHSLGCWSALYMNVSKGTGSIGTCQDSVFIVLLPCHVKKISGFGLCFIRCCCEQHASLKRNRWYFQWRPASVIKNQNMSE